MSEPIQTIGQILDNPPPRDAIHVAIASMTSEVMLHPAQRIYVNANGQALPTGPQYHGIVDPYLSHSVTPGKWFWMFLAPNTVTGMRHHWEHPAFPDPTRPSLAQLESDGPEAWFEKFGREIGLTGWKVVEYARETLQTGDHSGPNNEDMRDHYYEHKTEFWRQYALLTGDSVPEDVFPPFWCSC